jgi:hypothetical protein
MLTVESEMRSPTIAWVVNALIWLSEKAMSQPFARVVWRKLIPSVSS